MSRRIGPLGENKSSCNTFQFSMSVVANMRDLTMKLSLLIELSCRACLEMLPFGTQRPFIDPPKFSLK